MTPRKKDESYEVKTREILDGFLDSAKQEETEKRTLPIKSIQPNQEQPRKYFDQEKLDQLIASIRNTGILQPIVVRPLENGKYQIVAGERRYRAAMSAELREMPVVIKDLTDEEVQEVALVENITREDLNPIEETQAIVELIANRLGYSTDETIELIQKGSHENRESALKIKETKEWEVVILVFQKLGKFTPQGFRVNRLPLLNLPRDVLDAISKGKIAYSKGRMIGRVKDKRKRLSLLEEAIQKNLSREEIAKKVSRLNSKKESAKGGKQDLIERLDSIIKKAKREIKRGNNPKKQEAIDNLLKELERILR